ncbi:phosphoribosyltransferase [[Eubacterium] cellulosolvens]
MKAELTENIEYRNKTQIFNDRIHAGNLLGDILKKRRQRFILFAIPSGGIPVCYAISKKLDIDFDILIARKLQIPWNTEAGFGAISWDGEVVFNERLLNELDLSEDSINKIIQETQTSINHRIKKFRGNRPFPNITGKKVVVVDDGLASGYTMLSVVKSLKKRNSEKIIIAVPTASASSIELLSKNVEEIICLNLRSGPFFAVADAYKIWYDLADEEIIKYLI